MLQVKGAFTILVSQPTWVNYNFQYLLCQTFAYENCTTFRAKCKILCDLQQYPLHCNTQSTFTGMVNQWCGLHWWQLTAVAQ